MTQEYNKWKRIAYDMGSRDRSTFKMCSDCRELYHTPTLTWVGMKVVSGTEHHYKNRIKCTGEKRRQCELENRVKK